MLLSRFDDFSDGLWIIGESAPTNEQAGFALPPGGLLQADNVDFLPSGAVRGRRGSLKKNPAAQRPGKIVFLKRFYASSKTGQSFQADRGLAVNEDSFGTVDWLTPEGAVAAGDLVKARLNLIAGTTGHYLLRVASLVRNPVPPNATINGVALLLVFDQALYNYPFETARVRLYRQGAVIGAAPANENLGVPYPSDELPHVMWVGGPTEKWGLGATLTPALVQDPTFGIAYSALQPVGGGANSLFVDLMGIYVYYTAPGIDRFVVAHESGVNLIYETLSGGTFSSITGGTVDIPLRRPQAVNWAEKDKIFIFDGTNPAQQYDGNLMESIPTSDEVGIDPPRGPYVALHKSRLFATRPDELGQSVYACEVLDEKSWPSQYHLNVDDDLGGNITGLVSFGDYLLIFKDTCIFRMLGDPDVGPQLMRYEPLHGCIAPDSIAVTPDGVIYLARSGLRITDGETTVDVSEAVAPLFVERSDQSVYANAVGIYFPRKQQYWLKLDPECDEGYILHKISYPTDQGTAIKRIWSKIPVLPMNAADVWSGGVDEGELYIGDLLGWVREWDYGSQDDGEDFTSEIVTLRRQIDPQRRSRGRVNEIRPMYRGPNTITLGIRYDQVDTDDVTVTTGAPVGLPEFRETYDFVGEMATFGRFFSLHVAALGGPEFELYRLGADLRLRSRRRWD